MKIALGSDHRGYDLKERLKAFLVRLGMEIEDVGSIGKTSVDYPDYAAKVASMVSQGQVNLGILICGSGLGMSIAANKVPRIRAALCLTPEMAKTSRMHNNANVLSLGADLITPEQAEAIVEEWIKTDFEAVVRHKRRIKKMQQMESCASDPLEVYEKDPEIYATLVAEEKRQRDNLEMIASESIASKAVREAQGSVLTNKYAEGYPGRRWYAGCVNVDEAERLAVDRAKQLFDAEHVNVQPHSGSQANMAVYLTVLEPGDTIMAMKLPHGGHLTHGHKGNFSGRFFNIVSYGVSERDEQIDYDELATIAGQAKPKLIIAGASAYPRIIDFQRLRKIADAVGAYLMVDMAHIAGLVAAGCHPNPVPVSDFVTGTTHKTLCGPRGGMIMCKERFSEDIDAQVFPGVQGGPLMHVIAAKAVCFYEALRPSFRRYQQQVVKNAQKLAEVLAANGFRIVSGGTDNHLILVDVTPVGINGKDAAAALETVNIIINKNTIPFDKKGPATPSGIRIGTPVVTARGMKEEAMKTIADLISKALRDPGNDQLLATVKTAVRKLVDTYPMP